MRTVYCDNELCCVLLVKAGAKLILKTEPGLFQVDALQFDLDDGFGGRTVNVHRDMIHLYYILHFYSKS